MKLIKWFLKAGLAGILAFAILCAVFNFYTFMPIHKGNKGGNTDYIWPANTRWFKMTEGISTGKFDANGFNNLQVVENPDILILGSSHMEATDVPQDKNTAYVLGQLFEGEHTVYNMGISGHTFTKLVKYLPVSVEMFEEDPEYIILEISNPVVKQTQVDNLRAGKVAVDPSYDTGVIATMQKLPFFRLVYQQISGGLLKLFMPETRSSGSKATTPDPLSEEAYDGMFTYIQEAMEGCSAQLIILYQPTETLQKDGTVLFESDEAALAMLSSKCQEYGFVFVDMTDPFYRMYQESHKLPHGFVTGAIGTGHLNIDGHRCMAETLEKTIRALEQEG